MLQISGLMKKQVMGESDSFTFPEITDEDISWATSLLGLPEHAFYGKDRHDPRQEVLKSMEQIDISACPGSGKTTLLVAKLAILSKKWQYQTRGICVLSHTNAARREIETCSGNPSAGWRLLSYPHFIGTIHGFVNKFLAIPWLRSLGYPIKIIDTEMGQNKRWYALPEPTRCALTKNHLSRSVLSIKATDFSVGNVRWGKGQLKHDSPTYQNIQEVCKNSAQEGYFCFDEMFVWAEDIINNVPGIIEVIRQRFPILFIDEAQDNSEVQSTILHKIFIEGNNNVTRRRFGDPNQAIFNFVGGSRSKPDFPNGAPMDLPNSYRFGQEIADLADPLGLKPYSLIGQGPKEPLTSGKKGKNTIFLFDNNNIQEVLKAYAELLIKTFSKKELLDGTFTAVGMVHRPPEEEKAHKFPHHVAHYWPDYVPELSHQDPRPPTFIQYIFAGQGKANESGESYLVVEKIAEGILRLTDMAQGTISPYRRKYRHRYVMSLLDENAETRNSYEKFVAEFAAKRNVLTKELWEGHWREVVRQIAETLTGSTLVEEGNDFLKWKDAVSVSSSHPDIRSSCNNIYHYPVDNPDVHIRVGSIHSVKGETHTATLVLETFWYGTKKRHNLELLLPWLNGDKSGDASTGKQQKVRLKLHYVAMTRPTHLLCLAMKLRTFEDKRGDLNQALIQKIRKQGWDDIKII